MPEAPDDPATPRKAHFGFKANPMDKLFISHGGLSSLCFDRNAFFDDAFDVDGFLSSHTQRGIPLDVLKDDLCTYRKIVQSALVQLVDREYADFVHLSSSLVGVDKGIEKLRLPVEGHLAHVEKCLSVLNGYIQTLDAKISRRAEIDTQKQQLRCLISAMECMETLVGVDRILQEATATRARLPLLYRISDLLVRIRTDEPTISQTTWYAGVKSQLSFMDATFMKILGGELLLAVQSGEARTVQSYCIVYQHLDRTANAHQVVADGAIKPALSAVIRDSQFKKASLEDLLSDVYAVVEERFYSLAYAKHVDFVLQSLWVSLVGLLTSEIQAYLAPDQADLFRRNYAAVKAFMNKFTSLFAAVQKNFAREFWRHPATSSFLDRWSFPVYYQVRFMEIAAPLEEAMGLPLRKSAESGSDGKFQLEISMITWNAILRCWSPDVCLPELVHRFWKLSLLLISRYTSWLDKLKIDGSSLVTLPEVLSDIAIFQKLILQLPSGYVRPVLESDGKDVAGILPVLSESLDESVKGLRNLEDCFVGRLAEQVAVELSGIIKAVQDAPRLYRRTNRDAPSAAAPYVDAAFEILTRKLGRDAGLSPDHLKNAYRVALHDVLTQFAALALDLLESVRRMEDSLKKLRKTRLVADAGLSDDDKIRLQLSHDVLRVQHWVTELGFSVDDFGAFASAKDRVLSEKPE